MPLYLAHPGGRGGNLVEFKHAGVDDFVKVNPGIVGFDDSGLWLQGADNGAHPTGLFGANFRYFIKNHYITEFNLTYHEILYIVFVVAVGLIESFAAAKLRGHAQGIDHRADAVKPGHARLRGILAARSGHGAYGLGNRSRLAYSAGLDYYVVELAGGDNVGQLLHQVGLQRAAYATALQGNQVARVVALANYAPLLNQVGIDIYLTYIVNYHGKPDAAAVGKDFVEQGGLSAAQIAREQQNGSFFLCGHILF